MFNDDEHASIRSFQTIGLYPTIVIKILGMFFCVLLIQLCKRSEYFCHTCATLKGMKAQDFNEIVRIRCLIYTLISQRFFAALLTLFYFCLRLITVFIKHF